LAGRQFKKTETVFTGCKRRNNFLLPKSISGIQGCSDIPVALAGVEDLIVVIRSGKDGSLPAALITRKGKTQLVRDVVEEIKRKGRMEIL
jgi:hypothetical protein